MSSQSSPSQGGPSLPSNDVIIVTDVDGYIQFANSAADVLGQPHGNMRNQPVDTVVEAIDPNNEDTGFFAQVTAREIGTAVDVRLTLPQEPGAHRASVRLSRLSDQSEESSGYVIVLSGLGALTREQSEKPDSAPSSAAGNGDGKPRRKAVDEAHQRLEDRILNTQKFESLGVLAGGVAHHFNNLLTGMLGYASLALTELSPDSQIRWNIEQIESTAQRAAELTQQLLAYAGKGAYHVQAVNLTLTLTGMTSLLSVMTRNAVLRTNFAEPLPLIQGDLTQLRQMVTNLVTNAAEALIDEMGTITIATGTVQLDAEGIARLEVLGEGLSEARYVYLEIADTGCGIDHETRLRMFDPFFTTKSTGRGLGLPATLGIVRSHHGAIEVSSEPPHGSRIRVYLPALETSDSSPSTHRHWAPETKRPARGTVLVVDDEETVRGVLKLMLEKLGFDVLTAPDGLRGTEAFRAHQDEIVAVILDKTMPYLSGGETLERMREIRTDIPVILSSGYDCQEVTSGFDAGDLAGFLAKPYQLDALEETMQRIEKR